MVRSKSKATNVAYKIINNNKINNPNIRSKTKASTKQSSASYDRHEP